jgi:hypothetical protein
VLKQGGQLTSLNTVAGGWSDIQVGLVKSIALASDDTLCMLLAAGQLTGLNTVAGGWSTVDSNPDVQSISTGGDGYVYAVKFDGSRWRCTPNGLIRVA